MTMQEKTWYTRGRVDQLNRRAWPDLGNTPVTYRIAYEAGAESVLADEQDLMADTLAEIAEYETSPVVAALFAEDLALARKRLTLLEEPMPVRVAVHG